MWTNDCHNVWMLSHEASFLLHFDSVIFVIAALNGINNGHTFHFQAEHNFHSLADFYQQQTFCLLFSFSEKTQRGLKSVQAIN